MKLTDKNKKAMGQFASKMDCEGGLYEFYRYGWNDYLKNLPKEHVGVLKAFGKAADAVMKLDVYDWLKYDEGEE